MVLFHWQCAWLLGYLFGGKSSLELDAFKNGAVRKNEAKQCAGIIPTEPLL